MIYDEAVKAEIERVFKVFKSHIKQSQDFDFLWSDKVGYILLDISLNPRYMDGGMLIDTADELCRKMLDDISMDTFLMTKNDHTLQTADPLERAEIMRNWKPYIEQLPEYEYLCKELFAEE